MRPSLYRPLDKVDLIAPKHWDFAPIFSVLQQRFRYVIDVYEYEEIDWSPALHMYAPKLGGWFLSVARDAHLAGGYFPTQWEREWFDLPVDLGERGFGFGTLENMIDLAVQAKSAFAQFNCSAVVVFRPGPHWLRSRQRKGGFRANNSTGSAA